MKSAPSDDAIKRRPDRPARHDGGLNLLEVLVAFASAAIAVLYSGTVEGLLGSRLAARTEEGVARARSRLAVLCDAHPWRPVSSPATTPVDLPDERRSTVLRRKPWGGADRIRRRRHFGRIYLLSASPCPGRDPFGNNKYRSKRDVCAWAQPTGRD